MTRDSIFDFFSEFAPFIALAIAILVLWKVRTILVTQTVYEANERWSKDEAPILFRLRLGAYAVVGVIAFVVGAVELFRRLVG
ncbi:MAG: hypothetical protein JNL81_03590 [Hyphomonadaceae bacterium]|nr:hypothetical protein [Hyphomonadaceae bacterium]